MQDVQESKVSRKDILIRLLYTILYLFVFEIIKLIIQLIVLFQYIYLFITLSHSDRVRNFSNKLCTYTYDIISYLTLNKNQRPFPFNDFPAVMGEPVEEVTFR
jgi:hypothetical protein